MNDRLAVLMAIICLWGKLGEALSTKGFRGRTIVSSNRFNGVLTSSATSSIPAGFRDGSRSQTSCPAISALESANIQKKRSWLLSLLPKSPLFRVFKTKATNLWGILFGLQCWSLMFVWMIGMILFMPFKILFPNLDRNGILIDAGGRWWSRLVTFPHSIPRISGYENLPSRTEPCLYIANHASWLDIPIIGGYLPPMKFVCKKELTKVLHRRYPVVYLFMNSAQFIFDVTFPLCHTTRYRFQS